MIGDNAEPLDGWVCPTKPWNEACCCENPQSAAFLHRLADLILDGRGDN